MNLYIKHSINYYKDKIKFRSYTIDLRYRKNLKHNIKKNKIHDYLHNKFKSLLFSYINDINNRNIIRCLFNLVYLLEVIEFFILIHNKENREIE